MADDPDIIIASSKATAPSTTTTSVPTVQSKASKWSIDPSTIEKYNWLVHVMYARGEFEPCKQFIRNQQTKTYNLCEYMTYVQALIYRQEGSINEALDLFQTCVLMSPTVSNIKQVGKSLALLGRYRAAIDAYKEAATRSNEQDWEVLHNLGLCHMNMQEYLAAKQILQQAINVSDQESSYLALGKIYQLEGDKDEAEKIYEKGAKKNLESPHLSTRLGLMAFENKNYQKAFECFGNALTFSPTYIPAIMAACQVIQKHGDCDVALSKYRIIYAKKPESPQLWNNVGMCFFSKKKYVAAVSCLKRANYLAPFELYVLYNLALVHIHLQQYASSSIFLQSALRIDKKHAQSYSLLGLTLAKLNDVDNAIRAYEVAIQLDSTDPTTHLNLAVLLFNTTQNKQQIDKTLKTFREAYDRKVDIEGAREVDGTMLEIATKLSDAMQTNNTLKIEQPKSLPRSIKNFQDMPPLANEDEPWMKPDNLLPSTERVQQPAADDDEFPITSPRRQIEPVVEPKKELPVIKTKIFDDGRRRKTDRTQVTDNNNNGTAERPSAVPTDDDTFF